MLFMTFGSESFLSSFLPGKAVISMCPMYFIGMVLKDEFISFRLSSEMVSCLS